MKKIICLLTAALLLLAGCSTTTPTPTDEPVTPKLTAGTYSATATGFHGDLTVEVTVDETSILSVEVVDHVETRFISDNAIYALPEGIVAHQSVNVDSYSGATVSSRAVLSAVKNALKQAGDISAFETAPTKAAATDETLSTDVVVLGGGIAGLSAAITAAENGAKVTLVEKLDRVGGSTVVSGGILYATGSPINKDVDNDVDALVDYWMMRSENTADENMLKIAAEKSGATVQQLMDWGVLFSTTIAPTGTSTAMRGHYASNENAAGAATDGVDFIVPLLKKAEESGITILLSTEATELLVKDNAVVGVKANSDEKNYTINAKSVVIATGGYDLSSEMMKEHSPEMAGTWAVSSPGNTGDGIKMAEAVGAATEYTGGVIGFKIIDITKHYIEGSNLLGWLGLLGVTNDGVRFGNESADYPVFCTSLIEAKEAGAEKFYLITDSTVEMFAGLAEMAVASNLGFKADTIEDLAAAANINVENLKSTLDTYNAHAVAGEADEYGKTGLVPVGTAPFYAVEIKPATLGTIGGLQINETAQVLNTEGNPISGLYAAGEVANSHFFYKEYPASGSSISISATFGIIAGEQAASNAK